MRLNLTIEETVRVLKRAAEHDRGCKVCDSTRFLVEHMHYISDQWVSLEFDAHTQHSQAILKNRALRPIRLE